MLLQKAAGVGCRQTTSRGTLSVPRPHRTLGSILLLHFRLATRGALVVHQGERERVLVARIKGGTTTASPRGLSARALAVSRPSRSERACTRCLKTVSATDNVAEVRHGALLVERSLGAA